jgi:hypothetical protein
MMCPQTGRPPRFLEVGLKPFAKKLPLQGRWDLYDFRPIWWELHFEFVDKQPNGFPAVQQGSYWVGPRGRENVMGLFDFLRRRPAIRDAAAVAEFIDRNAAFLMQKGIYEYSRARAGHYSKVLFGESEFRTAVEIARWRAFPLGLSLIAEAVEGVLRPHFADRHAALEAVSALTLGAFDGYPVPEALGEAEWRERRAALAHRLQLIGMHPPKRVIDIPEQWLQTYFELMPIHEKLRGPDFPTMRNYLRAQTCNIHDEFVKRLDVGAVTASLRGAEAA